MRWVLVDVVIVALALMVLAGLVIGLWRKVTALGRDVARAGAAVGAATETLSPGQGAARKRVP